MRIRSRRSRGYSLPELLTVVAIMGVVTLICLPAFMQLMPQYRIRNAASEMTATLRMLRQKAAGTRTNWRMTIDPTNDRYSLARANGGAWIQIGANGRPTRGTPPGTNAEWMNLKPVDVDAASSTVITIDGAGASPAGGGTIILATATTRVRYNRYTITVAPSGAISTTPSKVP